MTIVLAGDLGGTKTSLRLAEKVVDISGVGISRNDDKQWRSLYEQRFISGNYREFVDLVHEFLSHAKKSLGKLPAISRACLGIAGPVHGRRSQLTNLGWHLDCDRLEVELGIRQISLINDFVAVGYGILSLQPDDLHTLQGGKERERSPIGVIGAGTGLGEAFLSWDGDRYEVYATEGGHTDFAPRNELETELLQYLQKRHARVSVERVVSGMGIVAIYQFLRDRFGDDLPELPDIAERVRRWEAGDVEADVAAAIANAALDQSVEPEQRNQLAVKTMQMFVSAYAAEAGNLALKLIPRGGLYIAGGIAPKILPLLQDRDQDGNFLQILKDKGRVSPVLADIPIHIVLNHDVGLSGATFHGLYGASR